MSPKTRFAATHFTQVDHAAIEQSMVSLREEVGGTIDLALVYATVELADQLEDLLPRLIEWLGTESILGCTAESIVANGLELEWQPAISVWVASLPQASIDLVHVHFRQFNGDGAFVGWPDDLISQTTEQTMLLAAGDPFSFPMDVFLARINSDYPRVPICGGMCSGSSQPGESRLMLSNRVHTDGAVVARISGDLQIHPVVSQGCRPIGEPMVVTKAEGNEIVELGGIAALRKISELYAELPTRDRTLVNQGLQIGRVINEYQEKFRYGDFLIRAVIGGDEESGSLTVADFVRPGQTVQFHVRDEATAHADLREMLTRLQADCPSISGGLLFTCNGRGTRLFSSANHDAELVHDTFGGIPLSGFFAAGEIGPVAGVNFLHGFTASAVLFEGDAYI